MKTILYWILSVSFFGGILNAQTTLFEENWGTSFTTVATSAKWPCKSSGASSYNSSGGCGGSGDYNYYLYGYNYIETQAITLGASCNKLNLTYLYNSSLGLPQVQIFTSSCGVSPAVSYTLPQASTCTPYTLDLDAYAGQTVYIRFDNNWSSNYFYFDDISITTGGSGCSGGGGSGNDYRWADDFNDNDLNLDYVGVTGDESYSGASWTLSGGTVLSTDKSSFTVNYNQTEAFPASDASSYSVRIPENGYIESPTMDLSSMEMFKINFFLNKQAPGVPSTDYNLTDVYLEFWNGSSWDRIVTYDPSISYSDNTDNKDIIESGFGYHCFTAYKSTTSPGNFYYDDALHVNSSYFHSGFKFRVMFGTFNSSFREPYIYLDNISFRADADGQTCIPCGLSFWYETGETRFGHDPEATASNHAARGYEVEIDNPYYSAAFDGPNARTEPNDGNAGVDNALYSVEWAVISEQKITNTTYTSVDYMNNDVTNVVNDDMSWDDSYAGPGYLYYRREYFGCNGEAGTYDPGTGMQYNFRFDYGLNFVPAYYHLNSSGIEMHGGATSVAEQFDSDIVCQNAILPVKLISFRGLNYAEVNELVWEVGSEKNNDYYLLEYSNDGVNYQKIEQIDGFGTTNERKTYQYEHIHNGAPLHYYRLSQFDFDGTNEVLGVVALRSEGLINAYPNPFKDQLSFDMKFTGQVRVLSVNGAVMFEGSLSPQESINTADWSEGVYFAWINGTSYKLMKN